MTSRAETWGVVGGGMLGLTLAMKLAEAGKSVSVLEAAHRFGGLADAWEVGPVRWDRHYHVILLSDQHLRGLLESIGLGNEIVWTTTRTEFYSAGSFHPLNNAIDFVRFPVLGLIDKARLAGTILYASRIKDGLKLEHIALQDWLVRLSGKRVYERIWKPLLRAKLGENHKHASAAFIWAIVRRLYAARRSGLKTEMFGFVKGGYATIVDRLTASLQMAGVQLECGVSVTAVRRAGDKLCVTTPSGDRLFDRVVLTTPAPVAARTAAELSDELKAALGNILYQGIICVSVVLKKPLHGAYITYIADEKPPFTAVIEMSALVDRAAYSGRTLVYLPWYVPSDDAAFDLSDDEISQKFSAALLRMYKHLSRSDIEAVKISRVRHVLPISTAGYSARVPPIKTNVPGLSIVNSAHIVNGTLNVNETVRLAEMAMTTLLDSSASGAVKSYESVGAIQSERDISRPLRPAPVSARHLGRIKK